MIIGIVAPEAEGVPCYGSGSLLFYCTGTHRSSGTSFVKGASPQRPVYLPTSWRMNWTEREATSGAIRLPLWRHLYESSLLLMRVTDDRSETPAMLQVFNRFEGRRRNFRKFLAALYCAFIYLRWIRWKIEKQMWCLTRNKTHFWWSL